MKVAFVSTYLPQKCGIATYTDYLTRALRRTKREVEITIIAEKEAAPVKEDGFEVLPCWRREDDYPSQIMKNLSSFDVFHVQHEYSIYGLDDRLPSLLKRIPRKIRKVVTLHCIRPSQFSERGKIDERYSAKIAKLADKVVVHLESQKSILERLGVERHKISVIPHGTEIIREDKIESRKKLNLPSNGNLILMFGFIKRHKRYEDVLDALKEIEKKRNDFHLIIAGTLSPSAKEEDKKYFDSIKRKIDELELRKHVILPGYFFPNEDVPYLFSACDLVLFPYYEEDRSASGAFHLAIGAGKPVIASRIPKFEELKHISDEMLILPLNSKGLASLILRLFEDEEFLRYVRERTDEYSRKTSWDSVARLHYEVYQS